jgi:hypothetical protein
MKKRNIIGFILITVLLITTNVISIAYFTNKVEQRDEELVTVYNRVTEQDKELANLQAVKEQYKELAKEHEALSISKQELEQENQSLLTTYQDLTAQYEKLKNDSTELEQRLTQMSSIMEQYSYALEFDPVTLEEYQVYIQELEDRILANGGLDKFENPKRWKNYGDFIIWLEDGSSEKWADEAITYLHKLPSKMLETLNQEGWMFVLTPRSLEEVYESGVSNTVGLTVYYRARIYVQNNSFSISYCTIHEVGHALDFINNFVSYDNKWKKIYETEAVNSGLTSYFTSSSSEYFAETFQKFFIDPEELEKDAPQTYEYLSKFIAQYESE